MKWPPMRLATFFVYSDRINSWLSIGRDAWVNNLNAAAKFRTYEEAIEAEVPQYEGYDFDDVYVLVSEVEWFDDGSYETTDSNLPKL
jgi:hypothetical protein